MKELKAIIVFALIIIVSIFQVSSLFSDLGPGETFFVRFFIAALVLIIAGMIIGYLYPKRWYLAGLTACAPVIVGILIFLTLPREPIEIPEGAQTLRISISKGKINLSIVNLKSGAFYVEQVNEGIEEHELAFLVYSKDQDITQMRLDNINYEKMKLSLRPLSPGLTDVNHISGDYFGTGKYIVLCLKRTQDDKSHLSLGEIKEFTIE